MSFVLIVTIMSIMHAECRYVECLYAERSGAHVAIVITLIMFA
jgi:hypothetical protein